jgi:uncharacterized Fe-S cluster-containing radical SAM superfamily protein
MRWPVEQPGGGLAHDVAERLREAIASKGQACVVLSGGQPGAVPRAPGGASWTGRR